MIGPFVEDCDACSAPSRVDCRVAAGDPAPDDEHVVLGPRLAPYSKG